jgi:hypothetical protein
MAVVGVNGGGGSSGGGMSDETAPADKIDESHKHK